MAPSSSITRDARNAQIEGAYAQIYCKKPVQLDLAKVDLKLRSASAKINKRKERESESDGEALKPPCGTPKKVAPLRISFTTRRIKGAEEKVANVEDWKATERMFRE